MRRCIIHFGLLKTGTTSIQQALFSVSESLKFTYVHFGTPYVGRSLMTAFCKPAWRLAPDLRGTSRAKSQKVKDELIKYTDNDCLTPLIISAEALSRFTYEELEDFIEFLRLRDLAIEAVAYIRDFSPWCESLFQQSVKYGTWHGGLFPLGGEAYRFAVEKFDRILGAESVQLWKYDRSLFPTGCVVRDFFQRLNIGVYDGKQTEFNKGIGLEAAKLLLTYHQSGLGAVCDESSFGKNALLANHIRGMPDTPVKFHPDLIARRAIEEAADLEWMENRLGESIHSARTQKGEHFSFIRSESDLQNFRPEALAWLAAQSGCQIHERGTPKETAIEVALAMNALRDKVCAAATEQTAGGKASVLPKIIWLFWSQGFAAAPQLVSTCVESWREKNPGWEVRLLDESSAEPYLRRAAIPWHWLEKLPLEKKANILRMRLLTEEGGVWADATTFCLRPLDEWLPDCISAGFFCFRDPGPDRLVANWFLASGPSNRLACLWRDAHEEFWSRCEFLHHSSYDGKNAGNLSCLQRSLLRIMHRVFDRNTRCTCYCTHIPTASCTIFTPAPCEEVPSGKASTGICHSRMRSL
jgi:hypothetical protein